MDAIKFGRNPLLGQTVVDLEDRWFSDQWQQLGVPKSTLPLFAITPSSAHSSHSTQSYVAAKFSRSAVRDTDTLPPQTRGDARSLNPRLGPLMLSLFTFFSKMRVGVFRTFAFRVTRLAFYVMQEKRRPPMRKRTDF